ncbi:MAG: ferrous iron transport protein B [Flavobacteriaceae bacterium]
MSNPIKIALVGNPNTGKTSLFNSLTGLHQKVGNYPGITVEKKIGSFHLENSQKVSVIDLPGTYSLNPSSLDESIVTEFLLDQNNKDFPDAVVVISEAENLKRNLLLFTQVKDLGLPVILVVNMVDQMQKKGIFIEVEALEKQLDTKIILTSTRKNTGIKELKKAIENFEGLSRKSVFSESESVYRKWLSETYKAGFQDIEDREKQVSVKKEQHRETVKRYQFIGAALKDTFKKDQSQATDFNSKLDRILTHKVFGYVIFVALLLVMFQAIFSWSAPVMDFIDESFSLFAEKIAALLPEGKLNDLISQGIIPGIGGVVIFVPQIAVLFLFISVLEESGYMSRVVFLMDKIMRKFGLSGKSVVPLISGNACAIPAIMATRNIEDWKERLITILVTPFSVCSARLPVYTILISLIIPEKRIFGFINTQALALLGMYLLGIVLALIAAVVLNKIIKSKSKSYFVIEMPTYKMPLFKNVFYTVVEKTKAFVWNAGKIILAVSIVLWFLASHGGKNFDNATQIVSAQYENVEIDEDELNAEIASYQIENSYVGMMGKAIEPVIKPLGYDWKIGIAIITSFAAREVFVGTLATIYSVEDADDEGTIRSRMEAATFADSGEKVFTLATGVSLLLFYAVALQCAATVAIVRRETNSWKWTMIQLVGMGILAYLFAFVGYTIFK